LGDELFDTDGPPDYRRTNGHDKYKSLIFAILRTRVGIEIGVLYKLD